MVFWDFSVPCCFPIMVSNGFERCSHCVPQSMPNRTTLYVISFAQNFTLQCKYEEDQRERPHNLPFT